MNRNTSFPGPTVHPPEYRTFRPRFFCQLASAAMLLLALACGGGSSETSVPPGDNPPPVVTYALSGAVTQSGTSDPLEGVVIQFSGSFTSTTTDASGHWSKSGLTGTVTVTPVLVGWSFQQASRQVSAAASDVDFVATAVPTYALSGAITQSGTSDPLEGVAIQFSGGATSTTTNASGQWSKTGLSGTITVTPVLAGWSFNPSSLEVSTAASDVNFVATAVSSSVQAMFLHHSTGQNVWAGGVPEWFDTFNAAHGTDYQVSEASFSTASGGNNPYDYWDTWINNPTGPHVLESLVGPNKLIIWKHCFPVCLIGEDTGTPSVSSSSQTQGNYKLQYAALKEKMHSYPNNLFLVWTGAVEAEGNMTAAQGQRAKAFFDWVKSTWDEAGDNIFLWDFYALETDDSSSLYVLSNYHDAGDSHPNAAFCQTVAPYFCNRIVDVIEGRGDSGHLDGKP